MNSGFFKSSAVIREQLRSISASLDKADKAAQI